jgi:hypothetical protein
MNTTLIKELFISVIVSSMVGNKKDSCIFIHIGSLKVFYNVPYQNIGIYYRIQIFCPVFTEQRCGWIIGWEINLIRIYRDIGSKILVLTPLKMQLNKKWLVRIPVFPDAAPVRIIFIQIEFNIINSRIPNEIIVCYRFIIVSAICCEITFVFKYFSNRVNIVG